MGIQPEECKQGNLCRYFDCIGVARILPGLILPRFFAVLLLVFPAFVAATQGLVEGVLSAPDYLDIFQETLEEISLVQALVFLALMLVMLLLYAYALYTLYLTVANALKKTVAVHVLALILLLIASSLITSLFSLVGH